MSPWVARRWWDFWKTAAFFSVSSLFSLRTAGTRHVPRSGPVLVLSNHQSFIDPVLVGLAVPRYSQFVHRETLQKSKALTWVMASLRGIPIDHRGMSREGMQATLDALGRGECVAMFPEGERTHDGKISDFKPGISLLIKRTQAPIVPVGIAGAYDAWPRTSKLPKPAPIFLPPTSGTIAVSIGQAIDSARFAKASRDEMLKELKAAVQVEADRAEHLRRKRRELPS